MYNIPVLLNHEISQKRENPAPEIKEIRSQKLLHKRESFQVALINLYFIFIKQ